VHVFQTDERVVALDDPDRNLMRLKHELSLSRKAVLETLYAMPVDEPDLAAATRHYEMDLQQIAGQPPVLDVVHLGLGSDGHTASLVSRDPVLDAARADVAVTGCYQGHRRMTLTYPVLNRAGIIVWLVTGNGKADVLRRLYEGGRGIPAGRVRSDRAVIVADKPAASLLNTHMSKTDAR
jgi:6-phosphogluconolactonase